MTVYRLDKRIIFPNPELADDDGLLAVGGDLSVDRLILAYQNGIFPWYNENEPILWWCPKDRYIIKPEKVRISKSMKRVLNKKDFIINYNNDFTGVITNCKEIREAKDGTWITDEIKNAYIKLFNYGFAECVEVVKNNELVGGIYGVRLGNCFFGESMFSKVPSGSKIALIYLAKKLKEENVLFIDCQFHTEHLESMGGEYISWQTYKDILDKNTRI